MDYADLGVGMLLIYYHPGIQVILIRYIDTYIIVAQDFRIIIILTDNCTS